MEKIASREELVRELNSLLEVVNANPEEEAHQLISGGELYVIVYRELLGSNCDYAIPLNCLRNGSYYDVTKDILYGLPVYFIGADSELTDVVAVVITNKSEQLPSAPLTELHPYFNGLLGRSYEGEVFTEYTEIPSLLEDLAANSLLNCRCEGQLVVPTHLLCQLTMSGLDCSKSDVDLRGTGGWGLEETKKVSKGVAFTDFLRRGTTLKVYDNSLKIINTSVSETEELDFMENFEWRKFYNNINELLICINLCHYEIVLNSYVTKGLYDIFNEKFN